MSNQGDVKISPQSDISDFKQKLVLILVLLQTGLALVLVITHVVQTQVISDEIYSVLFQRVLIVVFELIRLLFL